MFALPAIIVFISRQRSWLAAKVHALLLQINLRAIICSALGGSSERRQRLPGSAATFGEAFSRGAIVFGVAFLHTPASSTKSKRLALAFLAQHFASTRFLLAG